MQSVNYCENRKQCDDVGQTHNASDVIQLFNQQFSTSFNTRLEGGGTEPFYQPRNLLCEWDRVVFAHDYFASALHEVAHWCIAGSTRLLLEDYGYWYAPDGRTEQQQRLFERVEVKPQALEWVFSVASNYQFRLSADNLSGPGLTPQFKLNVYQQALDYRGGGLPSRAAMFVQALAEFYDTKPLSDENFSLAALG